VRGDLPAAMGLRVHKLRQEMQISQEELAARADLHRDYVGGIERGERDIGITALARLVHALGLSLAEFFQPFRQR
jgi:transcriptional regulator with XRE-family HTH domain